MTSTRTPRLLGQKQNKFLLTVCLCALTAALIFLPFYLLDGGFFHYAGDFNSQQISFYRYMNGFLKGLSYPDGAGSVRNTFSWATDLGSGAMNAYSFYLNGSPFFWCVRAISTASARSDVLWLTQPCVKRVSIRESSTSAMMEAAPAISAALP